MKINIIAAVARNGVIGKDNKLPWRISEDLKRFKALTMGHVLIMGRKTYESIGKPLPGRTTIVLSHSGFKAEGVNVVGDLVAAIGKGAGRGVHPRTDYFICGGSTVYAEALRLNLADRIYLTHIEEDTVGDVHFPEWDKTQFKCTEKSTVWGTPSPGSTPGLTLGLTYWFETWDRVKL